MNNEYMQTTEERNMTKDTITGVSTIVVDHGRNKQLFYYGAFTETGATQTMKTNQMVELIEKWIKSS